MKDKRITYCPICKKEMRFIETIHDTKEERKTAWTCPECINVVYLIDLK